MKIIFKMRSGTQPISQAEFEEFQSNIIGEILPDDYRNHMLNICNGGIPQGNYYHVNYPDEGSEIRKLYPIKYGSSTMESIVDTIGNEIPQGHISIGQASGGAELLMSLNDYEHGVVKKWFPDGKVEKLSNSFTQFLEVQRIDD